MEHPEKADDRVTDLADDLEAEADRLEKHGNEVEGRIDEARDEWDRKRSDTSVPGANPPTPEGTNFPDGGNPAQGEGGPVGGD